MSAQRMELPPRLLALAVAIAEAEPIGEPLSAAQVVEAARERLADCSAAEICEAVRLLEDCGLGLIAAEGECIH